MNIRADIEHLKAKLALLQAEYPELADDEQLRADTFEAETDLNGIITRLLDGAREAKAMKDAIDIRLNELAKCHARYMRQAIVRRELILSVMEHAGLPKLTLPEATLSIRHDPPKPIVIDESALPSHCVRLVRKPDMEMIKAVIAESGMPDGVAMSNGRSVLTVRVK